MDQKEENYGSSFPSLDYSLDHHLHHHHQQQQQQHEHEADIMKTPRLGETSGDNNNNNNHHGMMIDYMLNNPHHHQQQQQQQHVPNSFDKLCFADVMQFADFGPKLSLNQTRIPEEDESGLDPVYFLKFPVLNEKLDNHNHNQTHSHGYNYPQSFMVPVQNGAISISNEESFENNNNAGEKNDEEQARVSVSASENNDMSVQLRFMEEEMQQNRKSGVGEGVKPNKRKRTRSVKTSEEVESQRMTHIAVERNRRKQMNEHLRVLRSLMPGSYVQRGDQASIIGGAIEFVRELEQLLQCLESQKRRRLLGESPGSGSRQLAGDSSTLAIQPPPPQAPLFPPAIPPPLPFPNVDLETGGLREETAENKSCLADVEVKVLGFDAMIKILSRRRPGQLIKAIAALEDLQLNILHTNITTIEQTVLYSFNVKVASESRFSAEDIANSVQQIFTFIHGSSSI